MKEKIKTIIKHPLISGGTILIVGSTITSGLNYLFNLVMGRFLSVSDYGIFASLMSIFNIFSVFSLTIMTVFTKFTASYVGKQKEEFIKPLFIKGTLWIGIISLFMCGIIIIFSSQISHFLNIDDRLLINITSAALFFSFLASVGIGVLQGTLKFGLLSYLNIFSSVVKLVLGIILILIGYKVLGAIGAFFFSSLFCYFFTFIPLFQYIKGGKFNEIDVPFLYKNLSIYGMPVFFSTLGMTGFLTIDIILVKHFFDPQVAGQYAALSLIGRSIFYVVAPITTALFPIIAQKKERKEKLFGTLSLSMLLIALPSLMLSIIYFVFPKLIISIFFPGDEYKTFAPLIGLFSISILFYSLSFLLTNFYLSVGKTRVFLLTIIGVVFEVIFIIFFHQSISQIINGLIAISFLLLLSLLLYYPKVSKSLL